MNSLEIIEQVRKKRLIFTVTTGRSGTGYLSTIFGYIKGLNAFHEPAPEYFKVLRQVQTNPDLAQKFLIEEKLSSIASDPAGIYVETSHLTCKGFLEPLLDLGVVPDLIIHRRAPRDVSLSMYKMGTIPGRTEKGLMFYLSPEDTDVLRLRNWQSLHDYQLCYWYCLEIERRAKKYKQIFRDRGARIAETTLQGLKTIEGFEQLLLDLDLTLKFPPWLTLKRFMRKTRVKVNESKEKKRYVHIPDCLEEFEQQVLDIIACEEG